jgi:hypothetical protein
MTTVPDGANPVRAATPLSPPQMPPGFRSYVDVDENERPTLLRAQPHERPSPVAAGEHLWAIQKDGPQLACQAPR